MLSTAGRHRPAGLDRAGAADLRCARRRSGASGNTRAEDGDPGLRGRQTLRGAFLKHEDGKFHITDQLADQVAIGDCQRIRGAPAADDMIECAGKALIGPHRVVQVKCQFRVGGCASWSVGREAGWRSAAGRAADAGMSTSDAGGL